MKGSGCFLLNRLGVAGLAAAVFGLLFTVGACRSARDDIIGAPREFFKPGKPKFKVVDPFPFDTVRRVAILPFEVREGIETGEAGETAREEIAEGDIVLAEKELEFAKRHAHMILRRVFFNYFAALNYSDRELSDVDMRLAVAGLEGSEEIEALKPQELGEILDVDGLLYGKVTRVTNVTTGIYTATVLKAHLRLVEARTGKELWSTKHQEAIRGGLVRTSQLIHYVSGEFGNRKAVIFVKVAEEYSRKVVATVPNPEAETRFPTIQDLSTNLEPDAVLGPGGRIVVEMTGDPENRASFSIEGFKDGIPMSEVAPGTYAGTYAVAHGDRIEGAALIGTLVNPGGNGSAIVYELSQVTIRGKSPASPKGLRGRVIGSEIFLEWEPAEEALEEYETSEGGYVVYRSERYSGDYRPVGNTRLEQFTEDLPRAVGEYIYRVLAYDAQQNLSGPSNAVTVRVVTEETAEESGAAPADARLEPAGTGGAGASPGGT